MKETFSYAKHLASPPIFFIAFGEKNIDEKTELLRNSFFLKKEPKTKGCPTPTNNAYCALQH